MIINKIEIKHITYSVFIFISCILLEMKLGKVADIRIELLIYLFLVSSYLCLFVFRHKLKLNFLQSIGKTGCTYVLFIFASSIWSVVPASTLQYAFIFLLSLFAITIRKKVNFYKIIQSFLFFLLILSVTSWLYYFLFGSLALSDKDVAWRLKGVLGHEQRLAIFMSIGIVLLFLERLKVGKKYPIYYYIFFFSTLFATQARAFIIFTILVVGLIYMIEGKKHIKLIFLLMVMFIVGGLASSADLISHKFSRGDADLTLTGRVPIWEYTLYRAEERPVLGFGYASYMKEGITSQMFRDYVPPHAHNTIVHSLFEIGAVGTFVLLLWMYQLSTLKTLKEKSYGFYLMVLAFLCGLMGIIFGTKMNGCLLMVLFLVMMEFDLRGKRYSHQSG